MASGLPIIASPHGGMKELVVDEVSGWIATGTSAEALASALRRALAALPSQRQNMGDAAAARVVKECDNDTVLRSHLEVKRRLVERHTRVRLQAAEDRQDNTTLAVVITTSAPDENVEACMASLRLQTARPSAIRTVNTRSTRADESLGSILDSLGENTSGIVFVRSDTELDRECLAICGRTLATDAAIGILSGWCRTADGKICIPSTPDDVAGLSTGSNAGFVAIRRSALSQLSVSDRQTAPTLEIVEAVARAGWLTLTFPAVLSSTTQTLDAGTRRSLRFSPIARAVQRLHTPLVDWFLTSSSEDIRTAVRQGLSTPARSARRLLRWTSRG
jgi:hypothetical protein